MSVVTVTGVSKAYRGYRILRDITFSMEAGKTYGLSGENGSGKSVLMKIIAGLVPPDQGQVEVLGKRVGKEVDFPDEMGILIDGPAFIPSYSARMNLRLLAAYRKKIGNAEIDSAIERVGLDYKSRKAVGKYSMGMRQRLGIAQAIMEDPQLLLLDEPFNGLDRAGAESARDLIRQLQGAGKTILLTSHNARDLAELCDQQFELDCGALLSGKSGA